MSSTSTVSTTWVPKVLPSYRVRQMLATLVSPQFLAVLPRLVPSPPTWLKPLAAIILLLNANTLPGWWHIRLFWPTLVHYLRSRSVYHWWVPFIKIRNKHAATKPETGRILRLDTMPLRKDIMEEEVVVHLRATPDLCDYLWHLSNSSYSTVVDYARGKAMVPYFWRFLTEGGRFHLGGSNFHFHKEIAIMRSFEIHLRVATWDDKWVYLLATFTSPSDPSTRRPTKPEPTGSRSPGMVLSRSASNLTRMLGDISRPEHEVKEAEAAAARSPQKAKDRSGYFSSTPRPAQASSSSSSSSTKEPIVYCTCVSRYCFKFGRKTIPPWFVVATSGFGSWASTAENWDKAESLRAEHARSLAEQKGKSRSKVDPSVGLLRAFDPLKSKSPVEGNEPNWHQKAFWHTAEWEERRIKGLQLIDKLGGLATNDATRSGQSTPSEV